MLVGSSLILVCFSSIASSGDAFPFSLFRFALFIAKLMLHELGYPTPRECSFLEFTLHLDLMLIAEPAAKPASGALLLSKLGNLSIREFWLSRNSHVSIRTSVRPHSLCGRGRGVPRQPDGGVENAIFSWREIARCFWATGVFLGGKSHDHCRF